MATTSSGRKAAQISTRLAAMGRNPSAHFGAVNTPVFRASTILYPTADAWLDAQTEKKASKRGIYYGRLGTPITRDLEDALCELEGGVQTFLFASGLAAIHQVIAAYARPNSRILISRTAYEPSKRSAELLCDTAQAECVVFDPLNLAGLPGLLDDRVALVLLESPGSNSFEICDVDAIAGVAHAVGAVVAVDNTWATPLLFQPLAHGADIAIEALTKYMSGHSDMLGGSVTVNEMARSRMKQFHETAGNCLGADECYSAHRGLRTLGIRLARHEANALTLARWLSGRPETLRVRHPAMPDNPGHDYWRRHFKGASGLFSVDFAGWGWDETRTFLNALKLFGIGASWGGFESLALPTGRLAGELDAAGTRFCRIRLHAGLEDGEDLIADMEAAFDAVRCG